MEFKTANWILDGLLRERTPLDLSKPTIHKEIIEIYSLQKIYKYMYLQGATSSQWPCAMLFGTFCLSICNQELELHH